MKYKFNYWTLPGLTVSFDYVKTVVAKQFGVDPGILTAHSRKREVVAPRQVCLFFGYTYMQMPGRALAQEMNLSNHATVIHSTKVVKGLYDVDKKYREKITNILLTLRINPETFKFLN